MKDDMRDSLKQDFLNREGWGDAALSPSPGMPPIAAMSVW